MDFNEYRKRGKEMVDYIADYLENIRDRPVFPDVKPGYMRNLLPDSAPLEGENWDAIFGDIERIIMPGVTHWQSPHMHAYFPALNSFPSLLGDMLADAINCLGFTWASSPACTELETIVMNWLGKMIGLPDEFLHAGSGGKGGGVIQTTASEATLVCLLAGRTQAIQRFHERSPGLQDAEINARLVAYCSDQAHSSVEKAALIGLVRMRYIESDETLSLRGGPLREAIEDDIKQGLIPFWVCGTLGTTGACAFDDLEEVGSVCREYKLWLHLDAAYAGSAFICPEHRIWLKGIEKADSIAFNPSKWLMVHFDCTAMWVKDSTAVHRTFNVEPLYLQHENSGLAIDYMHWQIPLSKRFRALKLWFVLRSYGIKGLQKHIREGVRLAQKFEALILADYRFEIPAPRYLGMVVFRIKGENEPTEKLLKRLNNRGKLHCVPASLKGKYVIRFTVTSTRTTVEDILSDWAEIRVVTSEILEEHNVKIPMDHAKISLKETKEKSEAFGSSLLLSNSPMSPKIVNGSFAAIFDSEEFLSKTYAGIRIAHQDSPSMRRRVKGILMSGKQFSLDSHMDLVAHSCIDSSREGADAAIDESNEDVWEAYESPGTPPKSPSPLLSPFLQSAPETEMDVAQAQSPSAQTRCALGAETSGMGLVQSKSSPNTLTIFNPNRKVRRMVYVHTSVDTSSLPQLSGSQTVCDCPNLVVVPSSCSLSGDRLGAPAKSGKSPKHVQSPPAVYHGKRYLDPILPEMCAFYNNAFRAAAGAARYAFQSSVYSAAAMPEIAEIGFEDYVDWDALKRSLSEDKEPQSFPKIRVRVCDEHGQRVRTSFDSSSCEATSSSDADTISPSSLWSSLECEISEGITVGNDGWTIIQNRQTPCCKKCGHNQSGEVS